ncbi:MAG: carboxylate--amine ligase [Methylovirgula sp.]
MSVTLRSGVPAVVVLGGLNGLGITRSLGCGDVTTYVVDSDRTHPGMWSRYARPVHSKGIEGRELIDSLLKLQAGLGERPVLFNTHEMAVLTISEHRSELESMFRFRMPKHEMVLTLQDKTKFHQLAVANDLPVPRGEVLRASSDIFKLLSSLHFPIVVKPADKGQVHSGKAPGVVIFERLEEAVVGCEEMLQRAGEAIVQEWIDGTSDKIYFCLFYRGRQGKIVSMFTGRKLASSPPGIGLTAYCTAAPEARESLEPMTEAFLERIDYAGIGSVEYKWDAAGRRFLIIEPTVGRSDWQEEVATLCGINIPLEAYCHELELTPPARPLPTSDIVWRASLLEPLKTQRPILSATAQVYDGYWRRNDMMPALLHYSYGTLAASMRRLRRQINPTR